MPNMTYTCERCHRKTELYYCARVDEYLCDECSFDTTDDPPDDENTPVPVEQSPYYPSPKLIADG